MHGGHLIATPGRSGLPRLLLCAAALLASSWPSWGWAARLEIPFALHEQYLESLLRQRVFTGAGDSLRLNDDGSGCQYLELSEPRVSAGGGRLTLRTVAQARAGRAMGERCLLVLDWRGQLEFEQQPEIGTDGESIVLRTTSWRALRPDGGTDTLSTTVGRWLEQFQPADLRETRIDFQGPLSDLRTFLAGMTGAAAGAADPGGAGAGIRLDSLAIDAVAAQADQVRVALGVDVPDAAPQPRQAEPALSPEELAGLQQQLDAVDAFFTYTIKALADDAPEVEASAFLDVLMELRRELVAILAMQGRGRGEDPARRLFVDAWDGLAPLLRVIAEGQGQPADALHLVTFIGAGDALRALDRIGPSAGIEVSSDGLRRLARMLVPADTEDPLRRDEAVDPELRRSLGFGEPLPPPANYPRDDTSWIAWLIPRAVAAAALPPDTVQKLNNWVPRNKDMNVYLPMVRDVLNYTVSEQLRASELDPAYHQLFRWLVFTAAWQESCWRQFEAKDDMRVPVQSASGDLGIMQINATVWRGLYDLQGLRWDIVYNARAGADILDHYLINYALRHAEHRTTGSVDNLARSAYAAYNGGPRQYNRYRRADASADGVKIDSLFFEKFRKIKSGKELAVTACYGI